MAIQALSFLAEDDERFGQFLALSGLDASQIRAAAGQSGFWAGVLDHLVSDERMLMTFAEQSGLAPTEIAKAHSTLAGSGHFERSS